MKTINRYVIRLAKMITCIVTITYIFNLVDFAYTDDNGFARATYHDFYSQESVDTLFLGSSHVYDGVFPPLIDLYLNTNSCNLATESQRPVASYENLVEACRVYDIKNVYMDTYYILETGEYDKKNTINEISWSNWPYHKWSHNKIKKLYEIKDNEKRLEALFPFTRFRDHIFDTDWIQFHVDLKDSEIYKEYKYYEYTDEYFGERGGILRTARYGENREVPISQPHGTPEEMVLGENTKRVLKKMIDFCREKGISITFISVPMYEEVLNMVDYDVFYNSFLEFANEEEVQYWDFNLCKGEYLPIQDANLFRDAGHLNAEGANIFGGVLCRVISEEEEQKKEMFYSSYNEKLMREPPKTYGMCRYRIIKDDGKERDVLNIVATHPEKMEYKLGFEQLNSNNDVEEYVEFQDWDDNTCFEIDADKRGIFYLYWRFKGTEDSSELMKIRYRVQ